MTTAAAVALCAAALAFQASTNPAAAGDAASPVALFGTSEKASADLSQFPRWTGILDRYRSERALESAPCTRGTCALQKWRGFLRGLAGKPALQQLEAVNRYVNQTPYRTDLAAYGVVDHWATPREFLGRYGDCEDYVIAKYLSLRHLGWDASRIRLLVLNHEVRREIHAVLIAYVDGTAYVLDNLSARLLPHTAVSHYRPIYSINETTWYFHENWRPSSPTAVSALPLPQISAASTLPAAAARHGSEGQSAPAQANPVPQGAAPLAPPKPAVEGAARNAMSVLDNGQYQMR